MLSSSVRASTLVSASKHLSKNIQAHNAYVTPASYTFEQKRFVQTTPSVTKSAVEISMVEVEEKGDSSSPDYVKRFKMSTEVIVSKIFPAGFGWQSSSVIAEQYLNFPSDTISFALTTGLGDALGVLVGHYGFYAIKKAITKNPKILMRREAENGSLLASAAFCSGSVWQPIVNLLQAADLSFQGVFAGTWIGCGLAFYIGLRAGRTLLPRFLKYVEEPTYENSKNDASLSLAIGGATGFFVGTDAGYLPDQNFLIDVVGIMDSTSNLTGCVIAGTSTSLGFGATQSVLNIAYPRDKCWND